MKTLMGCGLLISDEAWRSMSLTSLTVSRWWRYLLVRRSKGFTVVEQILGSMHQKETVLLDGAAGVSDGDSILPSARFAQR